MVLFLGYLLIKLPVNIRKIIREEIEKLLSKSATEAQFDKDIKYLDGFKLLKKDIKNNTLLWVFEHVTKNYRVRFYIEKNNQKRKWKAKVFVYWKSETSDFTNAKGKDYEYSYGPYGDYKEMTDDLNRKLQNNPVLSLNNFTDDNRVQFDKDAFQMIKSLKDNSKLISAVKDSYFNDLKKLLKQIEPIESDEELIKFVKDKAFDFTEKQTFLLTLQKLHKLEFFISKEKLESLF